MNNFPIYLFFIIVMVAALYLKIKGKRQEDNIFPYEKKERLTTKAESEFFNILQQVVSDSYYIVPQVKLSSIISVSVNGKEYQKYLNKIDRKTVDFVLFNKQFSPIMVIELDDHSHDRESRKRRDNFVNELMEKTNLKIIHIKTSYSYNAEEIRNLIFEKREYN